MKHKKLVNIQAISKELTGDKRKIRANQVQSKYKKAFNELDDLLEYWINRTKRDLNE